MSLFTQAEIRQINDCYDDLKREISKRFDAGRLEKVDKAFIFANSAHDGVRRKSGEPYILHPVAAATIVARDLGLGATSVMAAILHDVVEDTDYTVEDIRNMFGENVARIVDGLTKLSGEMDTRQALTLKKMLMTLSDDVRVILIKLADRLHNMRTLDSLPPLKQLKVAGETLYLYAPLAHRLGLYAIKNELEELSFRFKYPEDYNHLLYQLHDQEEKRNYLVNEFIAPIRKRLAEENIECTVTHRLKSMYSIWTKMHTKGVTFDEVYDLLAIRIILKAKPGISEKRQCFEVLSLVTDIYAPKPDRIRDWITMPRANGYESLHVTVMGPQGKWVEVQIRTERMDQVAEYGFAAHYRYKGAGSTENEPDRWIERLRDHLASSDFDAFEFLDEFKLDLFESEIVVFTPKGKTITLPKNSTVIDVAYEIHSDLGNKCIGAKINQKLVPPSHVLQNGDQVEILTAENQVPQQEWLSFTTTSKARGKVKEALRSENKKHLENGREKVEEALKKLNAPVVSNTIKKIVAHYNLNNKEQLYSEVGMGILSLDDLKTIISRKSRNKFVNYWNITFKGKKKEDDAEKEPQEEEIEKIDKLKPFVLKENPDSINYSLAKCCNPIPGDDVIGYISSGDHIIIHKKNCQKAEKLVASQPDKIIAATWTRFKKLSYLTRLNLGGFDRVGIVSDITNVISKLHSINMRSVKFDTHDGLFEGDLFLYIHNADDLNQMIQELSRIKGIDKVIRVENLSE